MNTETTALTVVERAAVALGTAKHEVELHELVKKSSSITEIKNKDGREECHSALMTVKNARISIEHAGKAARDDATKFSKAVIAEEKRLISIVEKEEARLQGLRDEWDAKVEAEKQAMIEAERQRVAGIMARIEAIRDLPRQTVGKSAIEIKAMIDELTLQAPDDSYQEFKEQAETVRLTVISALADVEEIQREIEQAAEAARQEAERQRLIQEEEAARIKAERAELERLRAEHTEREAKAKAEREAAEAKARAEQEAIDKKRREEHAAAQAELKAAQDKLNAEREELERAQAIIKKAERDAIEAAERKEADHAEALIWNAMLDAQSAKEEQEALAVDAASDADFVPSVYQVIGCISWGFEVSEERALEWLRGMDFAAVSIQERKAA